MSSHNENVRTPEGDYRNGIASRSATSDETLPLVFAKQRSAPFLFELHDPLRGCVGRLAANPHALIARTDEESQKHVVWICRVQHREINNNKSRNKAL